MSPTPVSLTLITASAVPSTEKSSKRRSWKLSAERNEAWVAMAEISFEGKKYEALKQDIGNLPLIVVKAKKGYIACSYIDKETAEKVGDIAAFVSGVKSLDDMKRAKIRETTTWAEDLGIREGMSVKKALEIMDAQLE